MSEGRKTRRFGGGMTGKAKEKAKLNREWQQISAVSCSCCETRLMKSEFDLFIPTATGKKEEDWQ